MAKETEKIKAKDLDKATDNDRALTGAEAERLRSQIADDMRLRREAVARRGLGTIKGGHIEWGGPTGDASDVTTGLEDAEEGPEGDTGNNEPWISPE